MSVSVHTARGAVVTVTPGVVDDAADFAYLNGQCLALAKAMQNRGATIEVCLTGGGLAWEAETTAFNAWDTAKFVHALGSDNGTLYDIQGEHDRDSYLEMMRDLHGSAVLVEVSPEQLDALIAHPCTTPQDVDTADTMVRALWFDFEDAGDR